MLLVMELVEETVEVDRMVTVDLADQVDLVPEMALMEIEIILEA